MVQRMPAGDEFFMGTCSRTDRMRDGSTLGMVIHGGAVSGHFSPCCPAAGPVGLMQRGRGKEPSSSP